MAMSDPKDIIKAYGYVFIYAANLEYSLDGCYPHLARLGTVKSGGHEISQERFESKRFSDKVDIIRKYCFPKFDSSTNDIDWDYNNFQQLLNACLKAVSSHDFLLSRNMLGHRPLFSEGSGGNAYLVGRDGTRRPVTSQEVIDLANQLSALYPIDMRLSFLVSKHLGENPLNRAYG
ncbi:MAG: hypothetical protein WC043_04000 [Pseudobdellovibrionaceae bacterium]